MNPLAAIFDIVPGWVYALIVAGLTLTLGAQRMHLLSVQTKLAEVKQEFAEYVSEVEKNAAKNSEINRKIESQRNADARKAVEDMTHEKQKTKDAVASATSFRDGLYKLTDSTTSGGKGSGDSNPLGGGVKAAPAFGGLLQTCDRVAENLGRDAEDLATQVRALQVRYSSLLKPSAPASAPQ